MFIKSNQLNFKNAKTLGSGSFISQSGAYKGVIRQAWTYETKNGATMLDLMFETADNETARLNLCLFNTRGEETFQKKILDALQVIFNLPETMTAVQSKVRNRRNEEEAGFVYADLQNKIVGFVLQLAPEEFMASDGTVKVANRLNIRNIYNVKTGQTAKEMCDKEEPKAVSRLLKTLKDLPVKKLDQGATASREGGYGKDNGYPNNVRQTPAKSEFDTDDYPYPF